MAAVTTSDHEHPGRPRAGGATRERTCWRPRTPPGWRACSASWPIRFALGSSTPSIWSRSCASGTSPSSSAPARMPSATGCASCARPGSCRPARPAASSTTGWPPTSPSRCSSTACASSSSCPAPSSCVGGGVTEPTAVHDARLGATPGRRTTITTATTATTTTAATPTMFRRLFWINLVLALPVVFYSPMIQDWFGYTAAVLPGLHARRAGLRQPRVLLRRLGRSCRAAGASCAHRQPGMMLLIAMAITVAYGASLATEFGWFDLDFWWELAALIVDHAARPLAGDEGHRPGRRARSPRSPSCCPTRPNASRRRRRRDGPDPRAPRRRRRAGAARAAACRPTARSSRAPPSSTSR